MPDLPGVPAEEPFSYRLLYDLLEAEEHGRLHCDSLWSDSRAVLTPEIESLSLPDSLLGVYREQGGFQIRWKATHVDQAYGQVWFVDLDAFLSDDWPESLFFKKELLEREPFLRHFRIFDNATSELSCGIITEPGTTPDHTVYLHTGDEDITGMPITPLPVDVDGYLTMLAASRAYKNWPCILLDMEEGDLDSRLLQDFRADMPKLFPRFDWDEYLAIYQSVRRV